MKPLGWWLRHLHELLESSMTRALDAESLTRRHWQVLNTIALGARTPEETAISICAEIIANHTGHTAGSLKATDGPIH